MHTTKLPLLALLAILPLAACRTAASTDDGSPTLGDGPPTLSAPHGGFEYAVVNFGSLDAALAANSARRDFTAPPMEREVQVIVDHAANAWIVSATTADLVRVRQIAAQLDAGAAGPGERSAPGQSAAPEPTSKQVASWLARRHAEVILFEHQDAALAANAARQHLGTPDVVEPVILLVDRGANAWIALADPRDREHVLTIAAQYDRVDGPSPRTR